MGEGNSFSDWSEDFLLSSWKVALPETAEGKLGKEKPAATRNRQRSIFK
jgi:hypothetical protein